jgi:hypothetical protein
LKDDTQLEIIEQYVPRSMLSIRKAIDGILFNLFPEVSFEVDPNVPPTSRKQKPLVMISYCHVNIEFCDQILALLDAKCDIFDIWVDKRCCKSTGDVWESIAKGIKSAKLIVSIISKEYIESKSCRQEVIYATDRLKKPFLPIYLGKSNVSDWLGKMFLCCLTVVFLTEMLDCHRYDRYSNR